MSGDEDEVAESQSESMVPQAENAASGEPVDVVASAPIAAASGAAAVEKQPMAYWQAVISALSPEKQAAAWQFFQERELGLAKGATDTLSGLVLLLEANGLFMEACAKRLTDAAAMPILHAKHRGGGETLPVLESATAGTNGLEPCAVDQPVVGAAAPPASSTSPSTPPNQRYTLSKASPLPAQSPIIWCCAVLLAFVAGGLGAWLGAVHTRANADLQVKAQVRQIRTWLDVDEQARAILMSRKAELVFGFARDPSLGNRKVYTLTVKGVPILRAGKTKEGAGVIAFDSGGPDLTP